MVRIHCCQKGVLPCVDSHIPEGLHTITPHDITPKTSMRVSICLHTIKIHAVIIAVGVSQITSHACIPPSRDQMSHAC